MAADPALKIVDHKGSKSTGSEALLKANISNELVFAVVGHVGAGTSKVADTLKDVLSNKALAGGAFEVQIFKARDVIKAYAVSQGRTLPEKSDRLEDVQAFQDEGDRFRHDTSDFASVAKALILEIRKYRALSTGVSIEPNKPVVPDGKRRAYILDSIRHPAEVELLRRVYQDAFVLIGIVCEEGAREKRIMIKYKDAGSKAARDFMKRDATALEKYGQRVAYAFHLSDYFLDNSTERQLEDHTPNPEWTIAEDLSRLIKIVTHSAVVRPSSYETAMFHAHGAKMRSACMSRQVGAALMDREGNIVATGTNEVPKAGGGLYGEGFKDELDSRCVYRQVDGKYFCSNTTNQNRIIEELMEGIPELHVLPGARKGFLLQELRNGAIGNLIEFSRAVHAEMDAILSAARSGEPIVGTRLFVTTFPCHYCARHIVSAGIDEVQFIEPYLKSKALDLHNDSVTMTMHDWKAPSLGGQKVLFRPFTGVAPNLYKRAFYKDRDLKDDLTGEFKVGQPSWGGPWDLHKISYVQLEAELATS